MSRSTLLAAGFAALLAAGCGAGSPADDEAPISLLADGISPEELERRVAQFAPADIDFDDSVLEPWERAVLAKLVEASDIMHELFTIQVSPRNPEWLAALENAPGAGNDAALAYFDIMVGPWDRLNHDEPFLDVGPKPEGAALPADLTRRSSAWLRRTPRTGNFRLFHGDPP